MSLVVSGLSFRVTGPFLQVFKLFVKAVTTTYRCHIADSSRPNSEKLWGGWLPKWLSGKESMPMQEVRLQALGREDPLEKEVATHSSILAWEILWTEKPGGLCPWRSQKSQTQLSD